MSIPTAPAERIDYCLKLAQEAYLSHIASLEDSSSKLKNEHAEFQLRISQLELKNKDLKEHLVTLEAKHQQALRQIQKYQKLQEMFHELEKDDDGDNHSSKKPSRNSARPSASVRGEQSPPASNVRERHESEQRSPSSSFRLHSGFKPTLFKEVRERMPAESFASFVEIIKRINHGDAEITADVVSKGVQLLRSSGCADLVSEFEVLLANHST
jgi:chemotaxis protein histidine kinase CheA